MWTRHTAPICGLYTSDINSTNSCNIEGGVTVRFVRNSRKTKNGHGQNGQSIQNGQKIGQNGQNGHRKTIFLKKKNENL